MHHAHAALPIMLFIAFMLLVSLTATEGRS